MVWFTYLFYSYYFWVPLVAVAAHRLTARLIRWFRVNRSLPPGPYGLPIVGYLPFLKRPNDFQGEMTDLSRQYGPIFSLKLGSELLVFLSDHHLIRDAFRRPHVFDARPQNEFFKLVKGYGKSCIYKELMSHLVLKSYRNRLCRRKAVERAAKVPPETYPTVSY